MAYESLQPSDEARMQKIKLMKRNETKRCEAKKRTEKKQIYDGGINWYKHGTLDRSRPLRNSATKSARVSISRCVYVSLAAKTQHLLIFFLFRCCVLTKEQHVFLAKNKKKRFTALHTRCTFKMATLSNRCSICFSRILFVSGCSRCANSYEIARV